MAYTIPSSEPAELRAGDTWRWTRALADFPASVWTLHYVLITSSQKISISATADGDTHSIAVAAATTAAYVADRYDWSAYVTSGADKHSIDSGSIVILPDLSAADTYDARSHARKMLEAIEATLENRATIGHLDLITAAYPNRSITTKPEELRKLRDHYAAIVRAEDRALAGKSVSGFVQQRF